MIMGDGSIRLLNVLTNNATTWNESPTSSQDRPTQLAFHPCQTFLVALLTSGTLVCWDTSATKDACLGPVKVRTSDKENIESVVFHGTLPFVLTVNNNGAITTWNFLSRKNNWIVKIVDTLGRWELSPAATELNTRFGHLPNFATKFAQEPVLLTRLTAHPSYNYFTFNFRFIGKITSDVLMSQLLLDSLRIGVYNLRLFDERDCHMIVPQQQSLMFWAKPEKEMRVKNLPKAAPTERGRSSLNTSSSSLPIGLTPRPGTNDKEEGSVKEFTNVFLFSNETFLLDDLNLLSYSPAYNDLSLAKKLPATDFEGRLLRPTRVVRSHLTDRFLVFFLRQDAAKELTTFGVAVVCRESATKDITISPAAGQSGIFFGNDDEFLVLSETGTHVEIWKNEEETTLPMVYELPFPISDIFWTPLEDANIIWFVDPQRCRIISSYKSHTSGSKFLLNQQCSLQLHPGEEVCQVAWHRWDDDHPPLAAIVTSRRVLIVDKSLHIIASAQEVASSCLWLGAAVVFKTRSHIQFLTVRNAVLPLISLRLPDAVLMTLLNDRVALAVRRAGETSVVTNAIGLLEPLVIGFLHYFEAGFDDFDRKERTQILLDCAESYDARRISWQLIEEVTKHGYREFALQLLLANPHLLAGHHQFAFELSLTTYHYSTAFSLIERSPALKTATNLYRLQKAAMRLGQFDVARKCAECASDWTTLLYLYTLAKNKEGLLILKKTLERDRDTNANTLALVERALQQPEIASLPATPDAIAIGSTSSKPAAASESQKLLAARQHTPMLTKLSAKNFHYTPHGILQNMSHVTNKRWKVENHTQVQCEMRTLPIEGGSGNLVVGPLLLNTLLGDWFTRQVPYFELPGVLQGDSAKREVILKLLAESQADMADRRRTLTVGGGQAPHSPNVPSLSLSGIAGNPKIPNPTTSRTATSIPNLTIPSASPVSGSSDTSRSPRKMATPNTALRPMTTAAANLINAIANSSSSMSKSSDGTSPNLLSLGTESSSPADSESFPTPGSAGPGTPNDSMTPILALAEQALTTDPLVLFTAALRKLESADYDGCVLDINSVLLSLLASNSQSGAIPSVNSLLRKQVLLCVRYKMACTLLFHIKKLDDLGVKAAQSAQLAQFLANIPLFPRHRLVVLRLALKKNLIVQNFGFASKVLALLMPKGLPDAPVLEKTNEECKKKNHRDSEPLAEGTRLCMKSFSSRWILAKHSYVVCSLCNATYHANLMSLAAPCAYCFWRGGLVLHGPPAADGAKVTKPAASSSAPKGSEAIGMAITKELVP